MNYLELLRNESPKGELSFMAMATTGIKKDDQIIAVFFGKETGPIYGMACEGISEAQLEGTYRYHRISKQLYDNMIKVDKDTLYKSMCNIFNNDVIVSYNKPFVLKMVNGLTDTQLEDLQIIDICKVYQWVQSGQIFNTQDEATYGRMMSYMGSWNSSQTPGIKHTIHTFIPGYAEDLSKPDPEAKVEALRCLCKSLENQPVRISQD